MTVWQQTTLKGRAFAIAANGNLLPARMAIGYLIPCQHLKPAGADDAASTCEFLMARENKLFTLALEQVPG